MIALSVKNNPCCRSCGEPLTDVFADLGSTPLANRNLRPGEEEQERSYPLIARICRSCLLVQVDDAVLPHDIFSDYDYFSSYSAMWVEHARRYSETMIERFSLSKDSQVVEIASNDGYLLQHFKAAGIPVHGIDPAANVAAAAIARGIPTSIAFFGVSTAREMSTNGLAADLMVANNVLAHVPDIRDFVGGFAELLKAGGVATFEFPHILRLMENAQFDTIYHEHYYYLSLIAAETIFATAGLRVFDVEELSTHGGSLRLFVCHESATHKPTERLSHVRNDEKKHRLDTIDGYHSFASKIAAVKDSFFTFLHEAKQNGKRVAAYGAAAKGNTFLNVCGVKCPEIIAVYDLNPAKQGKLTPGSHIPIKPPSAIETDRPDFVVILPWNLAEEIKDSMSVVETLGGRFVVAVPSSRVI